MLISFNLSLLTLLAFLTGLTLFRKFGQFPLLHPLVIGSACIALLLKSFNIDYARYQQASNLFYYLLGPATVALAVPMHQQFHRVKEAKGAIFATLTLGAVITPICGMITAYALGGDPVMTTAMLTKAVTTPIALGIAESSTGGDPGLVAGIVVFSGVVGAIFATPLFKLFNIHDPRAQGLTLGINAHAAGTTRGFELSETSGALSSLALALTGCITAVFLPLIIWLF